MRTVSGGLFDAAWASKYHCSVSVVSRILCVGIALGFELAILHTLCLFLPDTSSGIVLKIGLTVNWQNANGI